MMWIATIGAVVLGVGLLGGLALAARSRTPSPGPPPVEEQDGTVMLFAVHDSTRARLEGPIDELVRSPANLGRSKRQWAMRNVVKEIVGATDQWQLIGGWNAPLSDRAAVADVLSEWLGALRSREFRVRDESASGTGMSVLALVVCARVELLDFDTRPEHVSQGPFRSGRGLTPAHAMQSALQRLMALGLDDLVAFDVLWTPADAAHPVAPHAIQAAYPELIRAD